MPDNKILISTGTLSMEATLLEGPASSQFKNLLPLAGSANIWGDEIYFAVDIEMDLLENATDVVESGAVAFWPPGHAVCIFFGPTPASINTEIRAASPVNVLGRIEGDETLFKSVRAGDQVKIEIWKGC